MTILRGLGRALETRAGNPENPAVPLTSAVLLQWLGGQRVTAGVSVSETSALNMAAVWRCVWLISHVSSALPLAVYDSRQVRMPSPLVDDPHPEMTPLELWRLSYVYRCLWGNAYFQKARDSVGRVQWLYPITPNRVRVCRVPPSEANPWGKFFEVTLDDGSTDVFTPYDVLHIPGMGYDGVTGCSPVRAAREGIGLGLAAEHYGARLFGSGNLQAGILQTEQRLDSDQATALKSRWREKVQGLNNSHEIAVMDSGAKFQSLTMPNSDSQFLESRVFQTAEIGRFFGVPPFLLSITEKSTSWGTGLEQQAIGWVTYDLHPAWLAPTEQRITKELTPSGRYARYTVDGLLRGDSTARAAFYRVMREIGAMNADEVRERENLPAIPDGSGQGFLQPMNMQALGLHKGIENAGSGTNQEGGGDGGSD